MCVDLKDFAAVDPNLFISVYIVHISPLFLLFNAIYKQMFVFIAPISLIMPSPFLQ